MKNFIFIIMNLCILFYLYNMKNSNSIKITKKCLTDMKKKIEFNLDFDCNKMLDDYLSTNSNNVFKEGLMTFVVMLFAIVIIANMITIHAIPTIFIIIVIIYKIMQNSNNLSLKLLTIRQEQTQKNKIDKIDELLHTLNKPNINIPNLLIILYFIYSLIVFTTKIYC